MATKRLLPEGEVARIRQFADGFEIVELCDAHEALRAQVDEERRRTETAEAELDATRAVARRYRDGWRIALKGDPSRPLLARPDLDWWRPGWPDPEIEPITDAVRAALDALEDSNDGD